MIAIADMEPSHIPQVLAIERASFSIPWSEPSFMIELYSLGSRAYVAIEGEAVVGYLITKQVLREGHILNLAVRLDMRRKGIATLLIAQGLDDLKANGCMAVYLEVRASNNAALHIYEGLGFRKTGIRKAYYSVPIEDAVLMALEFAG